MSNSKTFIAAAFFAGIYLGAAGLSSISQHSFAGEAPPPTAAPVDIAALKAEVDRLKGLVPDQAHAMADVGYHFSNLWFAGHSENWPLAEFYANEMRSHLRWAVRMIPVRKDPKGTEIRLEDILNPIETGNLEALRKTIVAKDKAQFEPAYGSMMDSCYACHMAVGKPFLKPHIPERPEAPIIDMQPIKE